MPNDRSTERLLQRKKIAEEAGKSHPGEWGTAIRYNLKMTAVCAGKGEPLCMMTDDEDVATATHIALSDPGTTQQDIDEIIRLRQENELLALENQRLTVDGAKDESYLLTCLDIIRKAVGMPVGSEWQQVAERVDRLGKESDWLVKMLSLYTEDCPLKFSWVYAEKLPIPKIDDCEGTWSVDDCFHCSGRNPGQCWREAARKAVEEEERHG